MAQAPGAGVELHRWALAALCSPVVLTASAVPAVRREYGTMGHWAMWVFASAADMGEGAVAHCMRLLTESFPSWATRTLAARPAHPSAIADASLLNALAAPVLTAMGAFPDNLAISLGAVAFYQQTSAVLGVDLRRRAVAPIIRTLAHHGTVSGFVYRVFHWLEAVCIKGSGSDLTPLLPQVLTALAAPTSLADGTTLGMGVRVLVAHAGVAPPPHYPALVVPPLGTVLRVSLARNDTNTCGAVMRFLGEVDMNADPGWAHAVPLALACLSPPHVADAGGALLALARLWPLVPEPDDRIGAVEPLVLQAAGHDVAGYRLVRCLEVLAPNVGDPIACLGVLSLSRRPGVLVHPATTALHVRLNILVGRWTVARQAWCGAVARSRHRLRPAPAAPAPSPLG